MSDDPTIRQLAAMEAELRIEVERHCRIARGTLTWTGTANWYEERADALADAQRRLTTLQAVETLLQRGPLPTISEANMRACRGGRLCEYCGHQSHHSTTGACDFTFMVDNYNYRDWHHELLAALAPATPAEPVSP